MKIDLAREVPDYSKMEGSLGPEPSGPEKNLPKKTVYPSIYLDDAPVALCDVPIEGTALVKYRIDRTTIRRENGGESTASVEIEIMSFEPKSGKKSDEDSKKEESVEEAFGKWDSSKDDDDDSEEDDGEED